MSSSRVINSNKGTTKEVQFRSVVLGHLDSFRDKVKQELKELLLNRMPEGTEAMCFEVAVEGLFHEFPVRKVLQVEDGQYLWMDTLGGPCCGRMLLDHKKPVLPTELQSKLAQYNLACVDTFRVAGEAVVSFLSQCWDEACKDPNSFPYNVTVALPEERKAFDLKLKEWREYTRPRTYSQGSLH